ncbi:MAG: PDZ domain-containing protein [Alphaproteobacteria bacterium]|nr:PDZ domain-containing protein [Alphaproteobacteria bacterium]
MERRGRLQGVAVGIALALAVAAWVLALPPRGDDPPPWTLPQVELPPPPTYAPLEPLPARTVRAAAAPAAAEEQSPAPTVEVVPAASPDAPAYVTGTVTSDGGTPEGTVRVVGCGGQGPVDADGSFFFEVQPGPCELRAARQEGAFRVRSEPVAVEPAPGSEVRATLHLPAYTTGGVGARVRRHDLGIRIHALLEGAPAEAAGLRPGDVIVAVDGAPAVDMTVRDFVDLSLGRAGTEVTYSVLRNGREEQVTMTRTPLEGSRG